MQNNRNEKQSGIVPPFIGEPTPAKASGLTYSLSILMASVVAMLFFIALFASGVAGKDGYEKSNWYLYCSYALSPLAFALVAWLILRWTKTSVKEAVKTQKCAPRYFLVAVLLQIGLLSLSELNSLFLKFLARFGYTDTPILLPSMDGFGFIGVLFVVAVLPAVFEEIIFRGLLLKGMRAFGEIGAILISGGLFALYHQNPAQTIYQFCCGAAFALVAIRAGSILPTVLAHFINNALILTLEKFGVSSFSMPVYVVILILSGVCLVASMVWLIFIEKGKPQAIENEEEQKNERKNFWLFALVGIALCAFSWLSVLVTGV